jgi:hypothetical protein
MNTLNVSVCLINWAQPGLDDNGIPDEPVGLNKTACQIADCRE